MDSRWNAPITLALTHLFLNFWTISNQSGDRNDLFPCLIALAAGMIVLRHAHTISGEYGRITDTRMVTCYLVALMSSIPLGFTLGQPLPFSYIGVAFTMVGWMVLCMLFGGRPREEAESEGN